MNIDEIISEMRIINRKIMRMYMELQEHDRNRSIMFGNYKHQEKRLAELQGELNKEIFADVYESVFKKYENVPCGTPIEYKSIFEGRFR